MKNYTLIESSKTNLDKAKKTNYYPTYKLMKNGVAIADFFRICYIQKYGGYWFDIDVEPTQITIPDKGNIHLYDLGFKNISYMLIGGKPNQKLFQKVIDNVIINIHNNHPIKKQHINTCAQQGAKKQSRLILSFYFFRFNEQTRQPKQ